MDLYELSQGSENHSVYQAVADSNRYRHYDFLLSMIQAALDIQRPFISQSMIKAINFHAIVGLHHFAGAYRPCAVKVRNPEGHIVFKPPEWFRVQPMMDDLTNTVNWHWQAADPVGLTAFVLWKINHIHPFINGNGRTARAVCYFTLCVKSGGLLPGKRILPELLRQDEFQKPYQLALREADSGSLKKLIELIRQLLATQLQSG